MPNVRKREQRPLVVGLDMTLDDVDLLISLAHFYNRSMRPVRFMVRVVSPGDIRARYDFIAEESMWLRRFAEAARFEMEDSGDESVTMRFTPRSLVAFWGRVLAALRTPRARRRLNDRDLARYERLAAELESAIRSLSRRKPDLISAEISTRRPIEQEWMREQLARPAV